MYTSILSKRLQNYLDFEGLLEEEQNGFRSKRDCVEHIYSLTSVIRNRMTLGNSTFCAFIDFQKAFDWVDRDMLLYKMMCYNINGLFYKSVQQ